MIFLRVFRAAKPAPYGFGSLAVEVKRAVYKFYRFYTVEFFKAQKVLKCALRALCAYFSFRNGRKAVRAGKGAAAHAFVVNKPMRCFAHVAVIYSAFGKIAEVGRVYYSLARLACGYSFAKLWESLFPFTADNIICKRVFGKKFIVREKHLRPAENDFRARQNFFKCRCICAHIGNIPDICGKPVYLRARFRKCGKHGGALFFLVFFYYFIVKPVPFHAPRYCARGKARMAIGAVECKNHCFHFVASAPKMPCAAQHFRCIKIYFLLRCEPFVSAVSSGSSSSASASAALASARAAAFASRFFFISV